MLKRLALFFFFSMLTVLSASGFQIVIPDQPRPLVFPPGENVRYAAEFLQKYIRLTTGNNVGIVSEKQANPNSRKIYVGATERAQKYLKGKTPLKPEGFVIHPDGKDLVIAGETDSGNVDRGTLFGVYEFLERQLNVRWLYPSSPLWVSLGDGTVIPPNQTLCFPKETIVQAPAFQHRYGGIYLYERQPLEVQKLYHPVFRFGNTIPRQDANHTQNGWVKLYGKTHPEYFAKNTAGVPQINWKHPHLSYICLSSDAVLSQMMENLRKNGPENAWGERPPDATHVYFCCNDGMVPRTTCHCPKCAALLREKNVYEEVGSNLVHSYVKRYAEAIKREYPGKRLAVLAYSHYLAPPEGISIPDNVDVTYVGPRIHYLTESSFNRNLKYVKEWHRLLGNDRTRMGGWLNICSPALYISYAPFMYPDMLQRWLLATQNMISGWFVNGLSPYLRRWGANGLYGSIQTFPMVYIQSKLMWNPSDDWKKHLKDFCLIYGPAAETMQQFYELIIERWEQYPLEDNSQPELDHIHNIQYPEAVVARMKELMQKSLQLTKKDPKTHQKLVFLNKAVYGRFFRESANYHKNSAHVAFYQCLNRPEPPVVDGKMEPVWKNLPVFQLNHFRWGDPAKKKTEIRMLHSNGRIYFFAVLHQYVPEDELRLQCPRFLAANSGSYSPNIDRYWQNFTELKITSGGNVKYYGRFPAATVKTSIEGDKLLIEGSFKLYAADKYIPELRMQFQRYFGQWDNYDLWSPVIGGVTDYPTWRFGVIQIMPAMQKKNNGLE